MAKSAAHKMSLIYLTISYWVLVCLCGFIFVAAESVSSGVIVLFLTILLVSLLPSFFIAKELGLSGWYNEIVMCGVRKLGYSFSNLGRSDLAIKEWWEPIFVFYWGFTVKYLIPAVLWFIVCTGFKKALDSPYGGYAAHW